MEKTNFCVLLFFLVILSSLCNSQDYEYDDYNYNENYDYTDDYSQELNDYYGQNLLAPAPLPIPPPPTPPPTPPPPPPPMGKMTFFFFSTKVRKWRRVGSRDRYS